jgi:GTPase involved in cell partitioning and DNA repair
MDKERLLELAGVPVNLNEDTTEQEQKLARNTFKIMNKILDDLELLQSRVSHKSLLISMDKLDLVHEREAVEKAIDVAISEVEDFMPGLEAQARGE